MCLLGIAFKLYEDAPLLVLANREEFFARPSAGPQIFARNAETPAWLGGVDLLAGGTWLGVNEWGVLVAVTNRPEQSPPENPPSRGWLCRSLLAHRDSVSALAVALPELDGNRYAGCNLLIADRANAFVIEAGDTVKMSPLEPGLHLLANGPLNAADDLRIRRVRREFEVATLATADEWLREARQICQETGEGTEPAICLVGSDRGTVSSTVLAIGQNLATSQYWYAAGPPNAVPYEDFAPLFTGLLTGDFDADEISQSAKRQATAQIISIEPPDDSPARRAARESASHEIRPIAPSAPAALSGRGTRSEGDAALPYRIHLRGPWQCEPLARCERNASGALIWTDAGLPAVSTNRLPAAWQDLFGAFRGRIRFRRRFHPPSNITAADRLYIAFDAVGGSGQVSVNGQSLGPVTSPTASSKFEVTNLLGLNNEIVVELEFTDDAAVSPPGGLFAPVALEIVNGP